MSNETQDPNEQKANEIAQKLEVAKTSLTALEADTKDKQYALKIGSEENLDNLVKFITEKAHWKFTEALGVQQVFKKLEECKRQKLKNGCIFISALEVDAIHYFLSKAEGFGLAEAEFFLSILKPMNETIKLLTADRKQLEKLTQQIAAYENGINIDGEESATEEVAAKTKQAE